MAPVSIWQRFLDLFRPAPSHSTAQTPSASAPGVDKPFGEDAVDQSLIDGVNAVLRLDISDPDARAQHKADIFALLVDIDRRIDWIKANANGYPNGTISADVWFAGYRMAALGERLTEYFKAAGWLSNESNAANLWAKATLSVCSHYHNMVGPAMLAVADCAERLGEPDEAIRSYRAIVADFAWLADEWTEEAVAPLEDERIALSCLKTAAERLIALDGADGASPVPLAELIATLDVILSREAGPSE
jgi:hypothetical protein